MRWRPWIRATFLGIGLVVLGAARVGAQANVTGGIPTLLGPPATSAPVSPGPVTPLQPAGQGMGHGQGVGGGGPIMPMEGGGSQGMMTSALAPLVSPTTRLGTDTVQYDAAMDNRLKSPPGPEGLFGRSILEVERQLRSYGARPYSYAFGKYSRMTFSVYFLTLMFDRYRRLGAVIVSPKPPFTQVEPQVQQFLLKIFLASADLSKFQTILGQNRLEIWFEDNRRFGQTILEALERKDKFFR